MPLTRSIKSVCVNKLLEIASICISVDFNSSDVLIGLSPKSPAAADHTPTPSPAPIEGWRPTRLPDSSWGSLDAGCNPKALPPTPSDSPSLSGPEAANTETRPLPRSSSGPWSAPVDSINEQSLRRLMTANFSDKLNALPSVSYVAATTQLLGTLPK